MWHLLSPSIDPECRTDDHETEPNRSCLNPQPVGEVNETNDIQMA